jgi:hypothetical protein
MAEVVLGLGTSHSPQLSTPAKYWGGYAERDYRDQHLVTDDGLIRTYEQVLARAPSGLDREIVMEKWEQRYEACQQGIEELNSTLKKADLDALIVIGDDQKEMFTDDNMPAILVYWGDEFPVTPRPVFTADDKEHANATSMSELNAMALNSASWAYGNTHQIYPIKSDLAIHIVESLIADEFDVAHARLMREQQGMGHAFSFVCQRIMQDTIVPMVPIMLNTYFPPNQPSAHRSYALGQALKRAVDLWPQDARVGVMASGGLSHMVISEDLDRSVLNALRGRDVKTLYSIDRSVLQTGTSEILNWVTTGGATEHLDMHLIDYVPCYRTVAGTGCAMGFAKWT